MVQELTTGQVNVVSELGTVEQTSREGHLGLGRAGNGASSPHSTPLRSRRAHE